jgi:inhibitor of KinA sporulation pathway (predicted exonuclease)
MQESFIFFDLEYTWRDDNPDFFEKEVIQLAALRVDADTLSVIDKIALYVKPTLDPIIPQCEIDFTGITQEKVDAEGLAFPDAYMKFKNFVQDSVCFSHGWSRAATAIADGEILERNLEFNKMIDLSEPLYKNIAPWFRERYAENGINIEKQSAGQIAKLLGRERNLESLGLHEHDALYDCYSILEGIKHFGDAGLADA